LTPKYLSLFGVKTGVFYNESSRRTTHDDENLLKIRTIQQQESPLKQKKKEAKRGNPKI